MATHRRLCLRPWTWPRRSLPHGGPGRVGQAYSLLEETRMRRLRLLRQRSEECSSRGRSKVGAHDGGVNRPAGPPAPRLVFLSGLFISELEHRWLFRIVP